MPKSRNPTRHTVFDHPVPNCPYLFPTPAHPPEPHPSPALGGGNPFEMLASMGSGGLGGNMQSQIAGLMGMQGMGMQGMVGLHNIQQLNNENHYHQWH